MTNTNYQIGPKSPLPTRSGRKRIVLGVLSACALGIAFIVGWGDPVNSLHTSALSWFFTLGGATVGAYVFGAAWDNMNVLKGRS